MEDVEKLLRKTPEIQNRFNYRQTSVLNKALKTPEQIFKVESHRAAHNVTYDTARTDLLKLEKEGLLIKQKIAKAFAFTAPKQLKQKLIDL